ncbi:DUF2513 domain-containing protein [Allomuricauda sp. SCSIO 65647]|uniref:DUF2513 domain-containing protein n=1 Tax=Allomuricauda sp. SCSIO 65647 TaxID=2908843 RepID=UPI001F3E9CE4|nr:DUF2513 domain-containing protein [Muricauda sp. SCSIO 65647]UJH66589.1 DUF2513 domain-containing protein [Muricauda sp. SCSIO 65647]
MRRDMLCITEIIRKIEKSEYNGGEAPANFKIKGYSQKTVDYHIQLLKDADFIKTGMNPQNRELPTRLTWKGHEYVLQSLNSTVNVVKEGIDVVEDLM